MAKSAEIDGRGVEGVGGCYFYRAAGKGPDHGEGDSVSAFPGDLRYCGVGGGVEGEQKIMLGFIACEDGRVNCGGEDGGEVCECCGGEDGRVGGSYVFEGEEGDGAAS